MNNVQDQRRTWSEKFSDSFRGVKFAVSESSSFTVHLLMAAAVVALATLLRLDRVQWCILLLCIALVMAAEVFNYSLERLARAVTDEHHPEIGRALDAASGAVLISAMGAAVVGAWILLPPILSFFLDA